jgi:hypothetical protein
MVEVIPKFEKITEQNIPPEEINSWIEKATTQPELFRTMISAWRNYFDKTAVLLFEDERLVLEEWSEGWSNNLKPGSEIPLDKPSAFSIVASTGHPYHGYIRPSPVNDAFFTMASNNKYPDHVTICPVLVENVFLGMLLGTANKDVGLSLKLNVLEEQASAFGQRLHKILTSLPKAS